ncbi:MAG: hypothetical protein HRU46_14915, partial [Verrucomicrobiales bacterium]|nr:hypothetical protein [Verrucomicrobiales bacterium]
NSRGYALLDVVLAVALFALTVTGLVGVLQSINETSAELARDRMIQHQLTSLLAETKVMPVSSMNSERLDEVTDITYRTYVEEMELDNGEGNALSDLYMLTAEAVFMDSGEPQTETARIIVYQPERR